MKDKIRIDNHNINECLQEMMPEINERREAVVFKLGAEWCEPCQRLDEYLNSIDGKIEISAFQFVHIDWDANRSIFDCLDKYQYIDLNTMRIPSFLIFDHGISYSGYVVYDSTRPLADQIWNQLLESRILNNSASL